MEQIINIHIEKLPEGVTMDNYNTELAQPIKAAYNHLINDEMETAMQELEPGIEDDAGVTPDNGFLWGLERALERLDLALTFNKADKARKGLAQV